MPSYNEIFEPGYPLPKGIVLEPSSKMAFFDKRQLSSAEDRERAYKFAKTVTDELPYTERFPKLKVGRYIAATDEMPRHDKMFSGAVVRIEAFYPLLHHVEGRGMIEDHPSTKLLQTGRGWDVDQLYAEVLKGLWSIEDDQSVKLLLEHIQKK